jgi:hypothetical protein
MFAVGRSLLAFGRYGEQSGSNVDISSGQFMTDPQRTSTLRLFILHSGQCDRTLRNNCVCIPRRTTDNLSFLKNLRARKDGSQILTRRFRLQAHIRRHQNP